LEFEMNEQTFPLDRFQPNPWQPRESEDAEHIKALALDIAAHGLLQKPIGRMMDDDSIQLAFGHSRLAAYRWLNDVQDNSNLEGDWSSMPVIIQDLTDQQMCEMAISENLQRRDLTPIEVAKAMTRYRSEFGKTSAEIGALFGLSDSAVRNKMRLVELPEEIQKGIIEYGLSERSAREMLALYDIPEDVRNRTENYWNCKPEDIIDTFFKGATSEAIHERIESLIDHLSVEMSESLFKHDEVFDGDFRAPACKECSLRIQINSAPRCLDIECFRRKQDAWKLKYLTRASEASGIAVVDLNKEIGWLDGIWSYDKSHQHILEIGCENLRLRWSNYAHKMIDGFPNAEVVCTKTSGRCICKNALKSGILKTVEPVVEKPVGKTLAEVFAPEIVSESEPEAAPAPVKKLTAEDLKEFERQMRAKKRKGLEECKAIREDAIRCIHEALMDHNPVVWWKLVVQYVSFQKRDSMGLPPFITLMEILAEQIAIRIYDWQYGEPDPATSLQRYNKLFKAAGLPELISKLPENVSAETETQP